MLTLIGTNHMDIIKGYKRLKSLLEHFKPDFISIESTPHQERNLNRFIAARNDSNQFEELFNELITTYPESNPNTVKSVINYYYFEYSVAREYACKHDIPYLLSDDFDLVSDILESEESNFQGSIKRLVYRRSLNEIIESVEKVYKLDEYVFKNKELKDFITDRDITTSKILSELDGSGVHICGLGHIYGSFRNLNLYERLVLLDKDIQRIKLNEGDNFIR